MGRGLETIRLQPDPDGSAEIVGDALSGRSPALVFLHGMTSTRMGTKGDAILARARRRGLAFARFDFRGHGESSGKMRDITLTDLIGDARAVLRHMGKSVLIGSSMGGLVAAWCAARQPADVLALVLLSPALGYLPEMAQQTRSYALRRSDESPVVLREETLRDAEKYDEAELPGLLRVPLMVVHGAADRTVPARRSEEFCGRVAHLDKELWLIEGGTHSLNEDLTEILDRVEGFLAERGIV